MEQSSSWEANWFSASQEISRISWISKVHCRVYNSRHLSLSRARLIQSLPPLPLSWIFLAHLIRKCVKLLVIFIYLYFRFFAHTFAHNSVCFFVFIYSVDVHILGVFSENFDESDYKSMSSVWVNLWQYGAETTCKRKTLFPWDEEWQAGCRICHVSNVEHGGIPLS
jgi:hypothetical protein